MERDGRNVGGPLIHTTLFLIFLERLHIDFHMQKYEARPDYTIYNCIALINSLIKTRCGFRTNKYRLIWSPLAKTGDGEVKTILQKLT